MFRGYLDPFDSGFGRGFDPYFDGDDLRTGMIYLFILFHSSSR